MPPASTTAAHQQLSASSRLASLAIISMSDHFLRATSLSPSQKSQRENCQASFWRPFAFLNDNWHWWKATENCLLISFKLFNDADEVMSERAPFGREIVALAVATSHCFKEHNFITSCHLCLYHFKEPADWFVRGLMRAGAWRIRPINC